MKLKNLTWSTKLKFMKYIQTLLFGLVLSFTTNAQDTIPPEITLNNPFDTIFIEFGDSYLVESIIASDNISTEIELRKTLTVSGTYHTRFGSGPADECGLFTCVYGIQDEAGNEADFTRYILAAGDDEVPFMKFRHGNSIVVLEDSDFDPDTIWYEVSDNYFSKDELIVRIVKNTVDITETGVYYLKYEVEDPCGNILAMTLSVIVADKPRTDRHIPKIEVVLFLSSNKDFVKIELTGSGNSISEVRLISLNGKQQPTQFDGEMLSISEVLDGLYVLVIQTELGLITQKLRVLH